MPQHAEFSRAGQCLSAEGRCNSEQADQDGDRFEQVGDGKTTVEYFQAEGADLRRLGYFQRSAKR